MSEWQLLNLKRAYNLSVYFLVEFECPCKRQIILTGKPVLCRCGRMYSTEYSVFTREMEKRVGA